MVEFCQLPGQLPFQGTKKHSIWAGAQVEGGVYLFVCWKSKQKQENPILRPQKNPYNPIYIYTYINKEFELVPNSICGVLQSFLDQSPAATRSQTSPPKCSYFMLFHAKHNGLPPRGHLMLGSILVTFDPRLRLPQKPPSRRDFFGWWTARHHQCCWASQRARERADMFGRIHGSLADVDFPWFPESTEFLQ